MDLDKLLQSLMTGGAVALVSWFASWLLEEFSWWATLSSKVKQVAVLFGALVMGSLAIAYQTLVPPEIKAMLEPYFQMSILTISAWLASQIAHNINPKR